jgi:uncharacterized protein YrzB (UPF0473 family)
MRNDLFSEIDDEDGLDKAFEAIQAMRGKEFLLSYVSCTKSQD